MKHFVLAAAFAMGASASSAASLIVDDYSTFLSAETSAAAPTGPVIVSDAGVGAIGARDFSVDKITGAAGLGASTDSIPGVGLSLTSGPAVAAIHSTKYTMAAPLDVSMFNVIAFAVDFLDVAPVFFEAILTDGGGDSETDIVSLDATAPPGYVRSFNMANFTMVDLTDISMIEFKFAGLEGADLTIRNISFEVPVPAALPLLLTGLGGFGLLRLRRKS